VPSGHPLVLSLGISFPEQGFQRGDEARLLLYGRLTLREGTAQQHVLGPHLRAVEGLGWWLMVPTEADPPMPVEQVLQACDFGLLGTVTRFRTLESGAKGTRVVARSGHGSTSCTS